MDNSAHYSVDAHGMGQCGNTEMQPCMTPNILASHLRGQHQPTNLSGGICEGLGQLPKDALHAPDRCPLPKLHSPPVQYKCCSGGSMSKILREESTKARDSL